ncbi:MAG: hypothetical protein GY711_22045 [bacterium]|nr:hypothetical protein [bacterium]
MGLSIQNNLVASSVHLALYESTQRVERAAGHLSSGLRIRTAADDAGGLGVAVRMAARVRSTVAATRNVRDAVSVVQIAESALGQMQDNVARMREIVVQGMNGTLSDADRAVLAGEFDSRIAELQRLVNGTEFNGRQLFTRESMRIHVGPDDGDFLDLALPTELKATFGGLRSGSGSTSDFRNVLERLDEARSYVSRSRGEMGAAQNQLQTIERRLLTEREGLSAAVSRIRDVDVASEVSEYTRALALQEAGVAVAATANLAPAAALVLIARMGIQ